MIAVMSVIKCFVITVILIVFSCLSSVVSSNSGNAVQHSVRDSMRRFVGAAGGGGGYGSAYPYGPDSYPNAERMTADSSPVEQSSCNQRADCQSAHTYCDQQTHRCRCVSDYVDVYQFINSTRTKQSTLVCLPVAKLDDRCQSHEQCLVTHSACVFADPVGAVGYRNVSSHYCKCREGYHQEDRDESVVTRDNQRITNRPVCGEFVSMGNHWIGTFAIVCVMLLVLIIGCFVGIVRFQRWKQRPLSSTVTSLAEARGGHTPHLMSSSPPPMGSVEAEFQNDFIQVFPMHHLEPLPDKNTSHEYVINR